MIRQHPRQAVGRVLSVLGASLFLSAMIGQSNDGPWGGLPSWLGAASWFTFLGSLVVLVALGIYLAASLRYRRTTR